MRIHAKILGAGVEQSVRWSDDNPPLVGDSVTVNLGSGTETAIVRRREFVLDDTASRVAELILICEIQPRREST